MVQHPGVEQHPVVVQHPGVEQHPVVEQHSGVEQHSATGGTSVYQPMGLMSLWLFRTHPHAIHVFAVLQAPWSTEPCMSVLSILCQHVSKPKDMVKCNPEVAVPLALLVEQLQGRCACDAMCMAGQA